MQAAFWALIYTLLGCSLPVSLLNPCYSLANPPIDNFFPPGTHAILALLLKLGQSLWGIYSIKKKKIRWSKAKNNFFFQIYSFNLSEVLMTSNSLLRVILLNLLHDFPTARHIPRLTDVIKILNMRRMKISHQTCDFSFLLFF